MCNRHGKTLLTLSVALAVVALVATPALADNECYDSTVATHLLSIAKSPGALESYIQHSVNSNDSRRIKVGSNASSTYKASMYIDTIAELDSKVKTVQKFWQLVSDGGSCVTVSFELATVSVYFPVLWDVCGPSANISGGLTVGGSYETDGYGNWRLMPIIRDYVSGELSLQCGYTCFRVYGGIHTSGELGFEPYSCWPYYAIEDYSKLALGPDAGAELACWTVWSWSEDLYTNKKIYAVEWL